MKKTNKKTIKDLAKKLRPINDDLKMYSGGVKGTLDANSATCTGAPRNCGGGGPKY